MGDHERSRPLQQWPWPKLHQTEINGRKILLRIIKTVNGETAKLGKDNKNENNKNGNTLRGTTLGQRNTLGLQQTEKSEKNNLDDGKSHGTSVFGKKLIETRTFYVQTPQYCQAVSKSQIKTNTNFLLEL